MPMNTILKTSARKNVFYLLTTEGITKVLGLLTFVIMARSFSPSSYGAIALAFSVGSLFFIFFNLGLEHHLVRDIKHFLHTNDRDSIHRLMDSIATLKAWLLPAFSVIFLVVFWLMEWDSVYFFVLLFIFLHFYLVSALQLQFFTFRAFEQMRYELVVRVIHAAVALCFVGMVILMRGSEAAIGAGYALISLMILTVLTIFFSKKLDYQPRIRLKIRGQELALVMKTKYLFLTGICTSIFSGVDIIIISRVQDIASVGIYKNALMLTLALFMIPTAITQGLYPKLIQHNVEFSRFFLQIKKILVRLIPLSIAISAVLFLFGEQLIVGIFGQTYTASVPLFRLSLLAFLFASVNQVFGYGMIAIGKYKPYFFIVLLISIVSVVTNLIAIPRYGLMGGVGALALSHFLLIVFPLLYLSSSHARVKKEKMVQT